ncbi:hypothetical protein SLS58_006684 [Diplodia intermedia]|uniref:Uncharacterized protein n=1 Tax=Diplodia intermedia TaxID=856260 RepID=A0ABR3TMR1_9PEZI
MRVYANDDASHAGIQPLLGSFAAAFKAGAPAAKMAPVNNSSVTGALWFKPILARTACADERDGDLHHEKPAGYEVAVDVATWAVVVGEEDAEAGWTVHGFSAGEELGSGAALGAGLNFGNFTGLREGRQCVEVRDGDGGLIAVAKGGREVSADCPDGIYNLNPQVLELKEDVDEGGCAEDAKDGSSSDDGDKDGDGDGGDDDSWGVRAVAVDRVVVLAALFTSLVSVTGTWVLC